VIVLVGVSHKSAPIEVRERIARDAERASELAASLVRSGHASEAFVVSTCNRVEVVVATSSAHDAESLERVYRAALCDGDAALETYTYTHRDQAALRHLTRVAASLDSMVVGEPQILGQLKLGFESARTRGTVGTELHQIFARAVRGARRIRTETGIGAGQVSVPAIAIQLANQVFGDLSGHVALLVGSGEMGQAVARLLRDGGAQLLVAGRNLDRVTEVTKALGGTPHLLSDLPALLKSADVIVSSTSAPGFVLSRELMDSARRGRRGRHLLAIDLAVPRDIEPGAGDLDGVFLYNIDDLASVATQAHRSRRAEAERAETLVEEVVSGWERAQTTRQATPTIKALRAQIGSVLQLELDRSLRGRLRDLGEPERAALVAMLEAAQNRLLHHATARLREISAEGDAESLEQYSVVLGDLFALPPSSSPGVSEAPMARPSGAPRPGDEPSVEARSSPAAVDEAPCVGVRTSRG
jgi:glutamyl-tRNA reductase